MLFDTGRTRWKARQSRNKSIRQFPGLNSSLKKENGGKNLLHLLSISMSGDFKQNLCLAVRWLINALWWFCSCDLLELKMLLMMWLDRRDDCYSKNLLYSFLRYRYIGMSPEMASTPRVGDVWNVPEIQRATLCCIFHRMLRW